MIELNKLICAHCGQTRGKHMATSYNCPEQAGFHSTRRFKLAVNLLANDTHAATRLKGRSLHEIEREVARNLIKQLESQLGVFGFNRDINQADVLDGINLIRTGYDL